MSAFRTWHVDLTFIRRLREINWTLVLLVTLTASVGFAMLYSVAGGRFEPWALRQIVRFAVGLGIMVAVALIDIRIWLRYAYVIYAIALVLLVAVELVGRVGMGAQRWLDLGVIQVQPSEIMKIALVLSLARYFHTLDPDDIRRVRWLVAPILMALAPAALVLKQPDLGTAMMLLLGAAALFFVAGVRVWKFAVVAGAAVAALPIAWQFLRDYQKKRVLIFMNPEQDPLGAGYHILQSKIALGSGGMFGKGFMQGTQSQLNFLPEKQTDFIFTTFAEEMGLVGGLVLLALYALLIIYGYGIAFRSRSQFGRLVGVGITAMLFIYVFINIAMVSGLVPVVGVPLPMVSYGGTAMMTLLVGFGLLMGVYVNRDLEIPRRPGNIGL